jgi:Holliday junction resolvase RusA-like endonuclease
MAPITGGRGRWAWRTRLAEEARMARQTLENVGPETRFRLELVFHIDPLRIDRMDIDNLIRPVFDTLFVPTDPQLRIEGLTGALFDLDDGQVYRLIVEKQTAADRSEQGVEVRLTWE